MRKYFPIFSHLYFFTFIMVILFVCHKMLLLLLLQLLLDDGDDGDYIMILSHLSMNLFPLVSFLVTQLLKFSLPN